jgi:siroheme synthase
MNLIEGDIRIAQKSKAPGSANYGQDQLNSWGLEAVRKGKRVVRLKCGGK